MNKYITTARKAIEATYIGICDISEYKGTRDIVTKITNTKKEEVVKEKQPCRVSFEDSYSNEETENQSKTSQKIKLFISPDFIINPGSKIVVTQNGRTNIYKNSGIPAIYETHQEIMLEVWKGWA